MVVDDKKSRGKNKLAITEFKNREATVKAKSTNEFLSATAFRLQAYYLQLKASLYFYHALRVVLILLLMMVVHLRRWHLGSQQFVRS